MDCYIGLDSYITVDLHEGLQLEKNVLLISKEIDLRLKEMLLSL